MVTPIYKTVQENILSHIILATYRKFTVTTVRFTQNVSCSRKEGNVLFNNTLNTFYLQLYGVICIQLYASSSMVYIQNITRPSPQFASSSMVYIQDFTRPSPQFASSSMVYIQDFTRPSPQFASSSMVYISEGRREMFYLMPSIHFM